MVRVKQFDIWNGKPVPLYRIQNKNGLTADLIPYGATLVRLYTPDREGTLSDIVLGFDTVSDYETYSDNQGATIGRYANRIGGGRFVLHGAEYRLGKNDGENTLHGNDEFRRAMWRAEILSAQSVKFTYHSPDGANGFPGAMDASVTYTLDEEDRLVLQYEATGTEDMPMNLTNHSYFNLTGDPQQTIEGHVLKMHAEQFTPADETLIPTGVLAPVAGTAMDFRVPKPIGQDLHAECPTVKPCGGYDLNFCINGAHGTMRAAAELYEPKSGRILEVYTDLPGIQLYTGNWLKPLTGKDGVPFVRHGALCLETQFYPDTPNRPEFPQCTVKAGDVFRTMTIYRFSAK